MYDIKRNFNLTTTELKLKKNLSKTNLVRVIWPSQKKIFFFFLENMNEIE